MSNYLRDVEITAENALEFRKIVEGLERAKYLRMFADLMHKNKEIQQNAVEYFENWVCMTDKANAEWETTHKDCLRMYNDGTIVKCWLKAKRKIREEEKEKRRRKKLLAKLAKTNTNNKNL